MNSRKHKPQARPTAIDRLLQQDFLCRITILLFIDNVFWYRLWSCHRIPGRSFSLRGRQFSICARCTGIAVGAIFSYPFFLYFSSHFALAIAAMFIFFLDGITQYADIRESTNINRFFSGALIPGAALSILVLLASKIYGG